MCTHIILSIFSTHRIVGISTVPRPDHRAAQTREIACTKLVLPQVIHRGLSSICAFTTIVRALILITGLNITEVAHDYQPSIKKYVEELGMVNSYDTWHGMQSIEI